MNPSAANPEEARAAVEEVLASDTLARSDQLRSFLRYVSEKTLAGHGREINEYSVAVEALGKPADFSPSEDSSVRTRAYELRQKLQKFYETERPGALLRVELPKGSYTPRFTRMEDSASVPSKAKTVGFTHYALAFTTVAAIVFGVFAVRCSIQHSVDSAVKDAWGPLAQRGSEALVAVGTNLHMVVRPHMNVVAEGLPKYPAPPEIYPLFRQHRPLPEGLELDMHPVDNSVQLGHMIGVVQLAANLRALGVAYQILPERSVPAAAFRGRNVILIGDPQNSDAAARKLEKTPLTIEFDPKAQDLVVRERGGAGAVWTPKRGRDMRYTEVYGLITVLPGEGESGGPHRMVVLSGITSVGTHGAAEFFSKPETLALLRGRLGGFPVSYQVVVRCGSNDTQLLSTEYAAHRVLAEGSRKPDPRTQN